MVLSAGIFTTNSLDISLTTEAGKEEKVTGATAAAQDKVKEKEEEQEEKEKEEKKKQKHPKNKLFYNGNSPSYKWELAFDHICCIIHYKNNCKNITMFLKTKCTFSSKTKQCFLSFCFETLPCPNTSADRPWSAMAEDNTIMTCLGKGGRGVGTGGEGGGRGVGRGWFLLFLRCSTSQGRGREVVGVDNGMGQGEGWGGGEC